MLLYKHKNLWFFGFAGLMENLHGNLCEDMLFILNQKARRCIQCLRLSLGFQHILCFCGKIGFLVVLVPKSDLIQLANILFLHFFWISLMYLVLQSVSVKEFIFRIQFFLQIFYVFFNPLTSSVPINRN